MPSVEARIGSVKASACQVPTSTLEVIVTETPAHLRRRVDKETGLPLIAF